MLKIMTGAVLALFAMPAVAQQVGAAERNVTQARPAQDRPTAHPRPGNDDKAAYIAALRAAHQRAKNAVANGAEPARVRAKLQAYKQQLRQRWNATH